MKHTTQQGAETDVITITIDGQQIISCGDTMIFADKELSKDVNFYLEKISSDNGRNTFVAEIVNKYKNAFGKPMVVLIQSQLGDPICAYSGEDVYWTTETSIPKTTKLMIDDKPLYIHRANFQIIDLSLIE